VESCLVATKVVVINDLLPMSKATYLSADLGTAASFIALIAWAHDYLSIFPLHVVEMCACVCPYGWSIRSLICPLVGVSVLGLVLIHGLSSSAKGSAQVRRLLILEL
jgi:hypothetical protein